MVSIKGESDSILTQFWGKVDVNLGYTLNGHFVRLYAVLPVCEIILVMYYILSISNTCLILNFNIEYMLLANI